MRKANDANQQQDKREQDSQNQDSQQKSSQQQSSQQKSSQQKSAKPPLVFPEERLLVRPWNDPVLEELGHDPRGPYVERFWVAILGPTSTLLLRRISAALEASPEGFEADPVALAYELGLGIRGGKHSPFWRAVDRICRFNAAQRQGEVLSVRRKLAPLTMRQVEQLPPHLQVAHQAHAARRLAEHHRPQAVPGLALTDRPDAA